MAGQNTDRGKAFPGCMDRMQEMMRMMLSGKEGSACMEKMVRMMAECCPVIPRKKVRRIKRIRKHRDN